MTSIPPLQAPKRPREASEATFIGSLGAMRLTNAGQVLPMATTPENPTPTDGGIDLKDMLQEILAMISALSAKADWLRSQLQNREVGGGLGMPTHQPQPNGTLPLQIPQGDVQVFEASTESMWLAWAALDRALELGPQANEAQQEFAEIMKGIKASRSSCRCQPLSQELRRDADCRAA